MKNVCHAYRLVYSSCFPLFWICELCAFQYVPFLSKSKVLNILCVCNLHEHYQQQHDINWCNVVLLIQTSQFCILILVRTSISPSVSANWPPVWNKFQTENYKIINLLKLPATAWPQSYILQFVYTICPNTTETQRVRMTVGSDQLDAYQDVTSPAVGTFDAKIHLKSFISDVLQGPHSLLLCFTMQIY